MGPSPSKTKNFLCNFFFGFVRLFSQISPKGPPFIFLSILQKMDVKKRPILHVSALCDLRVTKKIFEKFQTKIGIFFSIFPQTGTVEEKT